MSAPRYSSDSYDTAADKYEKLAKKYSETDFSVDTNSAARQARTQAKGASELEGVAAQNVAKNAGYTRAKAAQEGAAARSNSYRNQYANSYNNAYSAMRANQDMKANQALNRLNAQSALLSGAQQKDANRYQSESNRFGAAMGGIGGIFTGASNALSDITKKDIHEETDAEARRAELLARLRG